MIKVAVINPYARPDGYSGPNILMDRLFSSLVRECSTTIVCGNPAAALNRGWAANVEVPVRLENVNSRSQLKWLLGAAWWMLRNSSKFDVVHVHGAYLFNLVSVLPCAILRRPYIIFPLGSDLSDSSRSSRLPGIQWLRRFIVSRAARGLSLAPGIDDQFRYWGLSDRRVRNIGNIAGAKFFNSSPSWAGQRLVFVGSLSARKRPVLILEVLAEIRQRGHNANALFVGPFADIETEREFERAIDQLGIDQWVTNLGYQKDVATAIAGSTVFVLPSAKEGLPGALVEAMAMGMPAVVTGVGAMGRIVGDAQSGAIVAPTVYEIADSLSEILSSKDLWRELSQNARSYAESHFSSAAVSKNYFRTLKEVCS